ncbi:hypothetical protein AFAEC_0071 [Aliarcobacter faecis]|uniref:hypothetical protein n=1 Tax=Aliarcobacter faecis TaxID=1564138 RepID=UPI00047D89C8|nr:hypothetical protein [Aliarcobacter faecis]QKF72293.1 hypothetical protein AFAEC_0071 [Aliarcobacter faecis]
MNSTNNKVKSLAKKINNNEKIKIAIFGLGSVGNYLLNYFLSLKDSQIEILVLGRNIEKLEQDVNIATVAASIRGELFSNIIVKKVDFNNIENIVDILKEENPDFIVNSSRAYSGIKYGGISWHNIRAYGIWTPLSISIIKNIMLAHKKASSDAIVINTSYSDAVNAWLKSSGLNYPDFGSGNLNHLIPRIKFAVKQELGLSIKDEINVIISTSHFHDVVISKEGQTEGINPLLNITVNKKDVILDINKIYKACAINMPTDQKRNMMNASSNFEIVVKIIKALREKKSLTFHSPGAFGEIGGYPIKIDGNLQEISFDESYFSYDDMRNHNKNSLYLDGIEKIEDATLYYTDELINKVKDVFNINLPKKIHFNEIDEVANLLIEKIIKVNI